MDKNTLNDLYFLLKKENGHDLSPRYNDDEKKRHWLKTICSFGHLLVTAYLDEHDEFAACKLI